MNLHFSSLLLVILLCPSCGKPPETPPAVSAASERAVSPQWFEDITARSGLAFVHETGTNFFMPEHIGSGAALLDYDNDGRLDIYLLQNAGPNSRSRNQLFHQEPAGHFKDASAGSGLDVAGWGMGVAAGDVNNDGWTDVLVTEYGGARLFQNSGNGTFTDITKSAGIDNPRWGVSAAFFDYDRDGWLDLVIANYVDYDPTHKCYDARGSLEYCGPHGFAGTVSRLFRNRGRRTDEPSTPRAGEADAVREPTRTLFEDVTIPSGLARRPGPALGVVCADFDGDHWPDIFLADDARPNRLFINRRDGTFGEEAAQRGLAFNAMGQPAANMGVALGDVDGNGLLDLFVTHLSEEFHALWTQNPRGVFQDRVVAAGLANASWRGTGFGALFADFNNDGALDLALVNGRIHRGDTPAPPPADVPNFWRPYAQRHQLFSGDGHGKFTDLSPEQPALCTQPSVGRGLATGDLDNDGATDLLVTSIASPARLLRNVAPQRGHWLTVRAIDPGAGGRDAYGAELVVQAGARRWWRLVNPAYSFLCSHDPRAHFGLGATEKFDSIEVLWPDGTREAFPGGAADRLLVLRKGEGRASPL